LSAVDSAVQAQDWNPGTEAERSAVRRQLEHILAHSIFKNSKRYPAFLGYVVEQALLGHTDQLKERIIGIEVFNCDLDYDTSNSAIVRVTALEVRRRLAQYYHEPGHEQELRIILHTGSYIPVFQLPAAASDGPVPDDSSGLRLISTGTTPPKISVAEVAPAEASAQAIAEKAPEKRNVRKWLLGAVVVAVLSCAAFLAYHRAWEPVSHTGFDQFWSQIADAHGAVQLCFGSWLESAPYAPGEPIGMDYVHGMEQITHLLDRLNKPYLSEARVLGPGAGEIDKFLNDGPIIYIGGYAPMAQMLAGGRYSFLIQNGGTHTVWVIDRQDPAKRQWRTEKNVSVDRRSESYAILARVIDRTLNRPVIIVTGISFGAAQAATEVLLNPAYMDRFLKDAPADWKDMNMEAVVETRVSDLKYSPPQIVATHFWK
jgi:hypothetical protein